MLPIRAALRPLRPACAGSSARVVLAAAVVALGLLAPVPAAAAEEGLLVVEGRGGTSTVMTVSTSAYAGGGAAVLTGGGPYAAALVESLDGPAPRLQLYAVKVRAFADETRDAQVQSGLGEVRPGRYRVTLLGRGAVRVVFPLREDDPGIRVTPTTPIPVSFLGRAEQQSAGFSDVRVDLPGAAPAGRRVLQVLLQDGTSAQDVRMCVTTGTGDCPGLPGPVCPPVAPCGDPLLPEPDVGRGEPRISALLHPAAPQPRRLLWTAEGYRTGDGRLRAAAILF